MAQDRPTDITEASNDVDDTGRETSLLNESGDFAGLVRLVESREGWCSAPTVSGAFSELFKTTVLPTINAGANLFARNSNGTFQGIIPATTPYGWRSVILMKPGVWTPVVPVASQYQRFMSHRR